MPKSKNVNIQGEFGYFKLVDWWLNTFDCNEQKRIEQGWRTTSDDVSLTTGHIYHTTETISQLLFCIASQLLVSDDYELAERVINKALTCVGSRVLELHFFYGNCGGIYYARRNKHPFALEAAIAAFQKQIAIAPQAAKAFRREDGYSTPLPIHMGYVQLAIIRANQKDYVEAIRLSKEVAEQGWRDTSVSWERRIQRYEKAFVLLRNSVG